MDTLEIESPELDYCPYCNSENIEGESPDPDCGSREVHCCTCGRYWHEGFTFTTIYIPPEHIRCYQENQFIIKNCKCGTDFICPVHEEGYKLHDGGVLEATNEGN